MLSSGQVLTHTGIDLPNLTLELNEPNKKIGSRTHLFLAELVERGSVAPPPEG